MSMDVIGDFLTVIRNGIMASMPTVNSSYSNFKYQIASILKNEGFIREVVIEGDGAKKVIKVVLKYVGNESVIHEIKRISTPGRRFYAGVTQVAPVIGGLGISILTTNRGVMTHKQARQLKVGGEIICTVW